MNHAEYEAFKLMQEIVELQEDIKLKQTMINNRMKLLHNFNQQKENINSFMKRLQPEYPRKISIEYQGPEPIPMKMAESYEPIPLQMKENYDPIPLSQNH